MKGKRRVGIVVVLALVAAVGIGREVANPSFPPGVEELLPYALVLWSPRNPWFFPEERQFLTAGDLDGDGNVDLVFGGHQSLDLVLTKPAEGRLELVPLCYTIQVTGREPLKGVAEMVFYKCAGFFQPLAALLVDLTSDGLPELVVSATSYDSTSRTDVTHLFVWYNRGEPLYFGDGSALEVRGGLPFASLWQAGLGPNSEHLIYGVVEEWSDGWISRVYSLQWVGWEGGGFAPAELVKEVPGRVIAVTDMDGDGLADLVVLTADEVLVFFNRQEGFVRGVRFLPTIGGPVGAAVGDLNVDGLLDLVVAGPEGLLSALQEEDGFVPYTKTSVGLTPRGVSVADFSGDGKLDAMVWSGSSLNVLLGDGQGGFVGVVSEHRLPSDTRPILAVGPRGDPVVVLQGQMAYWETRVLFVGGNPRGHSWLPFGGSYLVGVGDLSGNGRPDVLVQDGTNLEVLWNNGSGGLFRTRFANLGSTYPMAALVSGDQLWVLGVSEVGRWDLVALDRMGEVREQVPLELDVFPSLFLSDLDADGTPEILGTRSGKLWILWGGHRLVFYNDLVDIAALAVGDVLGLGTPQVVAAIGGSSIATVRFAAHAGAELHTLGSINASEVPFGLAVADLDGDGVDDVAAALVELTLEGLEDFLEGRASDQEVFLKVKRTTLALWLSQGGERTLDLTEYMAGDAPNILGGLLLADFNGDGHRDLAMSAMGGSGVLVFVNAGDGEFHLERSFSTPVGPMRAADFDGDGRAELLGSTLGYAYATLWILWNGGGQ